MAKDLLLLGTVTFGIGFGLSLFVNRTIEPALLTGLIAVPASYAGVLAVKGKQRLQHQSTLDLLQCQIDQLETQRIDLKQSIVAVVTERQQIETHINFLKTESSQLYTQVAQFRRHQQQLSQETAILTTDKQQLETKLQDLQTQVERCTQRKAELYHSLFALRQDKRETEENYKYLQLECDRLQIELREIQQQKQQLAEDITSINELKPQLQAKVVELRSQILEYQQTKYRLEQELEELARAKAQILLVNPEREQNINPWREFVQNLNKTELLVIQAIMYQNHPSVEIEKIADANMTMPKILLNQINDIALNTIGDLLVDPDAEFIPPGILSQHLIDLQQEIDKKVIGNGE
jgi:chromosome segregation ATPase